LKIHQTMRRNDGKDLSYSSNLGLRVETGRAKRLHCIVSAHDRDMWISDDWLGN
jgi:hypothetical protein